MAADPRPPSGDNAKVAGTPTHVTPNAEGKIKCPVCAYEVVVDEADDDDEGS